MKKLYLAVSLLFGGFFSQAQINKGTLLIGGNLSLGSTSTTIPDNPPFHQKATDFQFDPSVGLAVANNLVLGLDLGIGYESQGQDASYKENEYQAGVFLRKYKYLGSGFYFFAATEVAYDYSDQSEDQSAGSRSDTRQGDIDLNFSPGVAFALSRHWQLEFAFPDVVDLNYQHQKILSGIPTQGGSTQGESTETNNFVNFSSALSTSFQLEVGVRYLIGK